LTPAPEYSLFLQIVCSMKHHRHSFIRLLLAVWLAFGVMAAGLVAHAPELHSTLHAHHDHEGHDHGHENEDEGGTSDPHSCLAQLLADGICHASTPPPVLVGRSTALIGPELLDAELHFPHPGRRLPPGRAPPEI
jgi:hypothetical protein